MIHDHVEEIYFGEILQGEARAHNLPELTPGAALLQKGQPPADCSSLRQGHVCLNLYCTPRVQH